MRADSLETAGPFFEPPSLLPWVRRQRVDLLLVLPFIFFFYVQLSHHQVWRHVTKPWALAVSSHTFRELLYFARNEAHPYLWYLLLWIFSRATASILALKLVAAAIGTGTYLVLALASPFSRLEKLLLFCSYYVSFEYAVLARMYGLMLLLVLLYLRGRTSRPHSILRNAVWLGLIANADTYGVLLTFALLLEYGLFLSSERTWLQLNWRKRALPGLMLYLVFLAASFACLIPTKHVSLEGSKGGPLAHWRERIHLSEAVRTVTLDTWYPLDPGAPRHYWNISHQRHQTDVFLALVLLAVALQFRREKRLLFVLAVYCLMLILFMHLVYIGFSRHYGTMFVAFVAALWIQRSHDGQDPTLLPSATPFMPLAPRFALVPLGVCACAGVVVAYASWTHPFSQAGAAAQWLRANHYSHVPLIGTPDYSVANVSAHLGQPMYFLDCSCTDTFMQFWDRRDKFSQKDLPDRLVLAVAQAHQPYSIYVGIRPLTPNQVRAIANKSVEIVPLAQFTGAEEDQENFFLYKLKSANAGS